MKYLRTIVRTAAAATLVAGVLATPTGALADTSAQRFHASSGDNCRYGQTDGELSWQTITTGVQVTGTVIDRPGSTDPGSVCPDDRRYTIASFTGYSGRTVVDAQRRQVDNGRLDFRFILSGSTARVDRVVVQVCRASLYSASPIYCGAAQTYTP